MDDEAILPDATKLLPDKYVGLPSLQGYYYVLPLQLLAGLQRDHKLGPKLDPNFIRMDTELTNATKDIERAVGFHNEVPILYHLLGERPLFANDPHLPRLFGMTQERIEANLKILKPKLSAANRDACAYNGWLFSNADFLAEYRTLTTRGEESINRYGFPKPVTSRGLRFEESYQLVFKTNSPAEGQWVNDLLVFYQRWQLTGMAGPYLPLPVQPHSPPLSHDLSSNEFRGNAAAMSLPSICPTPTETQLRTSVEWLSGRKRSDDHLKPWMEIVENANKQRTKQLDSYAKRFELAHFWRVFHERYGTQIGQTKESVLAVFADYIQLETRQLRRLIAELKHSGLVANI